MLTVELEAPASELGISDRHTTTSDRRKREEKAQPTEIRFLHLSLPSMIGESFDWHRW
jgi:hypothetical protein